MSKKTPKNFENIHLTFCFNKNRNFCCIGCVWGKLGVVDDVELFSATNFLKTLIGEDYNVEIDLCTKSYNILSFSMTEKDLVKLYNTIKEVTILSSDTGILLLDSDGSLSRLPTN